MTSIITKLITAILGMKFGWIIAIVGAIILILSLLRNVVTGSFNVAKFAGGFNLLSGSVQGKLIYYGLIIFGCFVAYSFIMRPTTSFDTDYRNNIRQNRDVYLDQRVGETCSEKCAIAIQPFGFTVLKFACVKSCQASITQQSKVETPKVVEKIIEVKPTEKVIPENKKFKKNK